MSTIKDRQRAAARARLEKEMAERAAAAKKRRQRQAIIGSALAVVVIAGAAVWIVAALGNDDSPGGEAAAPPPGTVACHWIPEDGSTGGKVKDTGGLPPANVPNTGKSTLTIDTSLGVVTAAVDLSKTPCTGAAFTYLAGKKFWDNSKCHRLTTEGIKVLQCGDPSASGKGYRETDGQGGPNFKYPEENLPTNAKPTYPKGTIAMAKTSAPSTTGSQFFIVYADTELPPDYTVLGTVTKGLDIVEGVAKAGSDNANGQGDGHPKKEIDIKSITMAAA
ncbi:peptidylprolyl isomerase [Couchioplanes azureus]|uniref:peptidylprolyl isomerase n=1 Tax=Couchioplanes caeruleus TaxID=56438 RepID=UPI00166FB9C4|nr:peptidylprolyl isomerase [Couchioplanes caeruleus]GGQ53896.1 peptidylprolyl isomerase [Couchioplanes caeruleus subsp. azureus]